MQKIYDNLVSWKVVFINLFMILFHMNVRAQADSDVLFLYLKNHATAFDLSDKPDSVINRLMEGKKLFVYGQGGSHNLTCNLTIPDKVVKSLSQMKDMRYRFCNYFIEWGRSMAYRQNLALAARTISAFQIFGYRQQPDTFWNVYISEIDSLKRFFDYGPTFRYVGIDFERDNSFYNSVRSILSTSSLNHKWLKKCVDSSYYFHLAPKENFQQEKAFVRYYYQLQTEFNEDSSNIRMAMEDEYAFDRIRYLMNNKNVKSRYDNRNPPMAQNILEALEDAGPKDIHLLCIGMAHALLKYNNTVAGRLNKDTSLKGKILNMNLYCLNCHSSAEASSNDLLDNFMKHHEIKDFIAAAEGKGDLVLFDLTQLPVKYKYLQACGDLLLLAKNQQ